MFHSIIREPDFIAVKTEKKEYASAGALNEDGIRIETEFSAEGLRVFLSAGESPAELIRLRWNLESPLKGRILGDVWERSYGDMRWEGMVPYRAMPWYFLVHDEETTAGYGVKVRPGALCFWQADPKGISLWLDVRNGGQGVILAGRKLLAAEIVFEIYEGISSFQAARKFCSRMCSDPVFPPHPVYGSNNWYYAYGNSSEQEILKDTDYLVSLTEHLENRPYMVIDDGWQQKRSPDYIGGPWVGNERFPDMEKLARTIREKGAIPGIWVRFLLDNSDTIPSEWRLTHTGCLDPSHPDVIAHIKKDISRICGWGYRLIKHDFSTFDVFGKWGFAMQPLMADAGWHFYDRSRTTAEILVDFYREIFESASETETLIIGCNTIGHLGAGLMHLNRTGDDTSGVFWERTVRTGVNALAFRMMQHRTFYDVDADCLGITEKIPWEKNRLWAEILAVSGTPMFVSAKPGVLDERQNKILADCLRQASLQRHIAEPLDWEETSHPCRWKSGDTEYSFDWYEEEGLRVVAGPGVVWEGAENSRYFY